MDAYEGHKACHKAASVALGIWTENSFGLPSQSASLALFLYL